MTRPTAGGLFVDNANLVVSLERHEDTRIDFAVFHEVLAREASKLAGIEIAFPVRCFYSTYRPGEEARKAGFYRRLKESGWSVSTRPAKHYQDGHWEDKGSDLAIALDAHGMVYRKYIGAVAVVTDDSDFAALFERLPLDVKGFAVGWDNRMARELKQYAAPIYLGALLPEIAMKEHA